MSRKGSAMEVKDIIQNLEMLAHLGLRRSDSGRAAKGFLYWLAGENDLRGGLYGGLELRNLSPMEREAALAVLTWWLQTSSYLPLFEALSILEEPPFVPCSIVPKSGSFETLDRTSDRTSRERR